MTWRTAKELAEQTGISERYIRGMIRRRQVNLTSDPKWRVLGVDDGQGGDEGDDVTPFTGIGFYSRPPSSGKPEAIVVSVGGPKNRAIVATRDEPTRRATAGAIADDETMVFNSVTVVYCKKTGVVEIRAPGGVAVPLCTLADAQAIRNALNGHSHTYIPGSNTPTATTGNPAVPAPVGTTVLKGQ